MWRGEAKDRLRDSRPRRAAAPLIVRRPDIRPSSLAPPPSRAAVAMSPSSSFHPIDRRPPICSSYLTNWLSSAPLRKKNLEAFVRRRGRSHGYHALTMFRS